MRLCANTGSKLHLVRPLGFEMDNARLRRAGLDYRDRTTVTVYDDWLTVRAQLAEHRWFAFTGKATRSFCEPEYRLGDVLVFGQESTGLPPQILADIADADQLRIPMIPGSRSLNVSNAVAVAVYEGWRQQGFVNSSPGPDQRALPDLD